MRSFNNRFNAHVFVNETIAALPPANVNNVRGIGCTINEAKLTDDKTSVFTYIDKKMEALQKQVDQKFEGLQNRLDEKFRKLILVIANFEHVIENLQRIFSHDSVKNDNE